MTWAEALSKGRSRWLMWIAICSFLGCGFLIKGGRETDFLWAIVIGAANGTAVGFAVGPAAEKGATILSGILAGTPFYFIATSALVIDSIEARGVNRPDIILVSIFLILGVLFSLMQALRVRRQRVTTPSVAER